MLFDERLKAALDYLIRLASSSQFPQAKLPENTNIYWHMMMTSRVINLTIKEVQTAEHRIQSERAKQPRALELRDDIARIWRKLETQDVRERDRAGKIALKLDEKISTVNYHIRNLKLRKEKTR